MENNKELIDPIIFETEEDRNKLGFSKSKDISNKNNLIKPMDFDVRNKSIEEKVYIIFYILNDNDLDDNYTKIYSLCIGRTEAYNDIKNKLIEGRLVDIHRSKIMTETKQTETSSGDRKYYMIPYEECISIYSFCTSVKEYYSYDSFDIEDYNDSEVPEDSNELSKNSNYLTAEQLEYRKLLEASIARDKLFDNMRREDSNNPKNNI